MKSKVGSKYWHKIILILLCVLIAQELSAQRFWTNGAGDGLWSSGANWDLGAPPIPTETVTIGDGFITTVDAGFAGTIAGLTVGAGASGSVSLNRSLTVLGPVVLNPGAICMFVKGICYYTTGY